MATELLQQLEQKIQSTLDTIELLQLQLLTLTDANAKLTAENASLQQKQLAWEKNLHGMLAKLNSINAIEQQLVNKINEVTPA